jgi:hypothetical protein
MRRLARRTRLARTTAEATVAQSLSEPATRRIDADQSQGALAAMRRLIQAAHVLRLEAQEGRHHALLPALRPLASDLNDLLAVVDARLQDPGESTREAVPDLRASYLEFERSLPRDSESAALLAELDEIVDAANGLAALVGLDPADRNPEPGPSCS